MRDEGVDARELSVTECLDHIFVQPMFVMPEGSVCHREARVSTVLTAVVNGNIMLRGVTFSPEGSPERKQASFFTR